jgi:small GTP-binding protein
MSYNYLFKFLIIGNENVGKTSICKRMSGLEIDYYYDHTIGIEFSTCFTKIPGKLIKSHLWDTSGRRIFAPVITNYFKGIAGVILVYDVTNERSFKDIDYWLKQIEKNKSPEYEFKILLIGNKTDKKNRIITFEMGNNIAQKNNLLFFETSVKNNNNNIPKVKEEFCKLIYDSHDFNKSHPGIQLPKTLDFKKKEEQKQEGYFSDCCSCC